jgi:hypothetical protein
MPKICPFCGREVASEARYCIGCGHKVSTESESPTQEPTALTDLKACFGSFPGVQIIHCYVCADQDRCADLALSRQLLNLHEDLSALKAELKALRETAVDMEDGLVAVRGSINEGFQRTCSALNALSVSISRSTRIV